MMTQPQPHHDEDEGRERTQQNQRRTQQNEGKEEEEEKTEEITQVDEKLATRSEKAENVSAAAATSGESEATTPAALAVPKDYGDYHPLALRRLTAGVGSDDDDDDDSSDSGDDDTLLSPLEPNSAPFVIPSRAPASLAAAAIDDENDETLARIMGMMADDTSSSSAGGGAAAAAASAASPEKIDNNDTNTTASRKRTRPVDTPRVSFVQPQPNSASWTRGAWPRPRKCPVFTLFFNRNGQPIAPEDFNTIPEFDNAGTGLSPTTTSTESSSAGGGRQVTDSAEHHSFQCTITPVSGFRTFSSDDLRRNFVMLPQVLKTAGFMEAWGAGDGEDKHSNTSRTNNSSRSTTATTAKSNNKRKMMKRAKIKLGLHVIIDETAADVAIAEGTTLLPTAARKKREPSSSSSWTNAARTHKSQPPILINRWKK